MSHSVSPESSLFDTPPSHEVVVLEGLVTSTAWEGTSACNGYDVAPLAPERSTQWQVGTEECPEGCDVDEY